MVGCPQITGACSGRTAKATVPGGSKRPGGRAPRPRRPPQASLAAGLSGGLCCSTACSGGPVCRSLLKGVGRRSESALGLLSQTRALCPEEREP